MDFPPLQSLQAAGLSALLLMTGIGCVYDPYDYGYYEPPSYMVDPGPQGGPPPSRYNQQPRHGSRRYYDEGYQYGDRYEHSPRSSRRRDNYYNYGPRGPRQGGRNEYLNDERDGDWDDERRSEADERQRSSDETQERTPAEPQPQPRLRDDVVPSGPKPDTGTPKADPKDIKTATRAKTPGRVKSPYPPYTELDVSGLNPGSLAKDPTTGKVFRIP
ncbi:hypothetical protein [Verrucomicrobium sp. BvORR106]|uniref:hypothetical protein n=1 Tax=Verrucomicrobium sp. BvORR106 TaxID=1403819 RepID=UPI0005709182|nr:hypothetical protein [Verrucomicrobium sp. BvORR106]